MKYIFIMYFPSYETRMFSAYETQDSIFGSSIMVHHHITTEEYVDSCIEDSLRNGLDMMNL